MISLHTCLVVMIMAYPSLFSCSVISTLQLFSDLIGTRALWDNYWLDTSPPSNLPFIFRRVLVKGIYNCKLPLTSAQCCSCFVFISKIVDKNGIKMEENWTGDRGYAFACLSWTQGGTKQRKEQVIIDLETPIRKIQDGVEVLPNQNT